MSRLNYQEVRFTAYGREEMKTILKDRVDVAFRDGAVSGAAVDRAVEVTCEDSSDIRRARNLFLRAGVQAGREGANMVRVEQVEAAVNDGPGEGVDRFTRVARPPRSRLGCRGFR